MNRFNLFFANYPGFLSHKVLFQLEITKEIFGDNYLNYLAKKQQRKQQHVWERRHQNEKE